MQLYCGQLADTWWVQADDKQFMITFFFLSSGYD